MYRKYVKRFLDIILAIIAIVITLPIFLLTGILVLTFLILLRKKMLLS